MSDFTYNVDSWHN